MATKYSTVDDAADALRDAVKAKEMNIEDKSQRAELLLALDATETGSHVFGQVVDSFRRLYGSWARQLGFKGIWVVGPIAKLTIRLDKQGSMEADDK